ncbi:MAG: hypothetical protein K0V04_19425 [Deltaproteobacteria bacterium]|nr:hypothetical protein [Deltaproteobacteria bacterium]
MSLDEAEAHGGSRFRHARTDLTVSDSIRQIYVSVGDMTSVPEEFRPDFRDYVVEGVRTALEEWNDLYLQFVFVRKDSDTPQDNDRIARIYIDSGTLACGVDAWARWPRVDEVTGKTIPGPRITLDFNQIDEDEMEDADWMKRLFMHEFGHTVGIRHVDRHRHTCEEDKDEGIGAGWNHIDGTPQYPNYDQDSVMTACPRDPLVARWSDGDKMALGNLYPCITNCSP